MKTVSKQKIKAQLLPLIRKNSVKKVILFGSYATGKATRKSDLDLLIIMDTHKRFFNRHDDFEDIYQAFKGLAIDLLIYTPEELERISHRPFIREILHQGEVMYEC